LDVPPAEGTPTYLRLVARIQDIAAYRAAILAGSPKIAPSECERLSKRCDAFENQLNPHSGPLWHSMIGGDLSPGGKAVD
jgi:hypothetical protein